jgi:hypothetical protein
MIWTDEKLNRVFKGLSAGVSFFDAITALGKGLLIILSMYTVFIFWFFLMSFYQPYFYISILMIQVLQFSVMFAVGGFLFRLLLRYIRDILYYKQVEKIHQDIATKVKPLKNAGKTKKDS